MLRLQGVLFCSDFSIVSFLFLTRRTENSRSTLYEGFFERGFTTYAWRPRLTIDFMFAGVVSFCGVDKTIGGNGRASFLYCACEDASYRSVEFLTLFLRQRRAFSLGVYLCFKQALICIYIAESGDDFLIHQKSFYFGRFVPYLFSEVGTSEFFIERF